MATFTFHKGRHRASPLYWLRWWPILVNPSRISRKLLFTFDSKYLLDGDDQEDHNKLFGLSFGNVHRLSARFGWRYNTYKKKFILSAYCYLNGERHMDDLCECVANHPYTCEIIITNTEYLFRVTNERSELIANYNIAKGHKRKWAMLLGPFFGGNKPAPTTIKINLTK